MKINTVRPQDNVFTNQLTNIVNPPDTLYYCGKLPTEPVKAVAIVGSRKPTPYGREVTEKIVHILARHHIIIISGLALGIDSIAHKAALKFNTPTIAIMGRGLDEIYPSSHYNLAKDIIATGGTLISAYPEGVPAVPFHFLERNRIISGLADIIVVTEAAVKSGTLNTAKHALDQGKDVFVVPGNITSPMSVGCNRLLRQGAQPLIDPTDILAPLGISYSSSKEALSQLKRTDPVEQAILDAIINNIKDTNRIITETGIDASKIFNALSILEITGVITSTSEGGWTICP